MFENNHLNICRCFRCARLFRKETRVQSWNLAQWNYQAAHEGRVPGKVSQTKIPVRKKNDSIYLSPLKVGCHHCCQHLWIFVHTFVCDFSITWRFV